MCVAQWTELSIGALGNKGLPKLARCLKHYLQNWVHFAFYFSFSQYSREFLCVVQWIELSVGALCNEGVAKLARCLKHQLRH